MSLLYRIGTQFYYLLIRIAALFNAKAKQSILGRSEQRSVFKKFDFSKNTWIWFHCASLGEFEQGRPIIESFKSRYPDKKILLSFFSPSGYELCKSYEYADFICYLPYDSPSNARNFIAHVQPESAIFVKYEFWFYYLRTLKKNKIPSFLISATFRAEQLFFKSYGGFYKQMLFFFEQIFVQDEHSYTLLSKHGIENIQIAGDTRIDRVVEISKESWSDSKIESFQQNKPTWIMGSSWPQGESLIIPLLNEDFLKGWNCIIAPHDISQKHIEQIEKELKTPYVKYSDDSKTDFERAQVLIIDNIGLLSKLYRYGRFAYIGGGFGQGIHNTLEPIAFGLPVIFGPKYEKFEEAKVLIKTGGALAVTNGIEMKEALLSLTQQEQREKASQAATEYVASNVGASKKIMGYLEEKYNLSNS